MNSVDRAPLDKRPSAAVLRDAFGEELEFDVPLAPFTSFRTGGPAALFFRANSVGRAADAVRIARELGLDFFLLGGGSNLLVADSGYDGLVIKVDIRGLRLVDETTIECGAGEDLMALVDFATENSLTGLEFAAGIWGTVGGAIYGNAGAFGGEIGNNIRALTLIDRGGAVKTADAVYCRFGYRDSYLKETREIVAVAELALQPGAREDIGRKIEEILALRMTKHPDKLTAGCFFKNIPDPKEKYGKLPAGRLLEEVGAKGMSVGGAKVFEKHANIIVNTGTATSTDICQLAELVREKVRKRFGIELLEEVQKIGHF